LPFPRSDSFLLTGDTVYPGHRTGGDPAVPAGEVAAAGCVEQEGVCAAIPAGMNKTDELLIDKCSNPGQAVTLQPLSPRFDARQRITERSGM